jgi:N-sulfoglucosamine sulfohydrolase
MPMKTAFRTPALRERPAGRSGNRSLARMAISSKLQRVCLIIATFLAVSVALASAGTNRPPDIAIFLTDDQSQLDATPYGSTLRTPNMQRLADTGLTFTLAFVASPSCAPSRAALLTGLMPARNGAEPNHAKPRPEIKKWPAYFQELGYEVVAFGKVSHYGHTKDYGFDHFEHDTFHDPEGIPAAVRFLKNRPHENARPLCIFVGSNWPHVPWPTNSSGYDLAALTLPAGSVDTPRTREWRARYAAAVTKADDELGAIYDTARETLGENTLFLFSSDHGAQWPFAKWNLYDAGIRVPLIVSWPGLVKPHARTDAVVSWVDFLPTLVEIAGGTAPTNIDGRSFAGVLLGKTAQHRDRIFSTHSGDGHFNVYPTRSLRTDGWKYILNLNPDFAFTTHIDLPVNLGQRAYFATWEAAAKTNAQAAAIVKRYHERPAEELYDLTADPDEQHNLASTPAQVTRLREMRDELKTWMREQGDQQKVYDEPRLLSDPTSYGPGALPDKPAPKKKGEA